MKTWCLFLRAVNVAGHAPLKMEVLRAALGAAGFEDVRTLLASGNVILRADGEREQVVARVEAVIAGLVGHPVGVIARLPEEIDGLLVAVAPYEAALGGGEKLSATLLQASPTAAAVAKLAAFDAKGDASFPLEQTILVLTRHGYGETALSNDRIERLLGVKATTRNLATLRKVLGMVG